MRRFILQYVNRYTGEVRPTSISTYTKENADLLLQELERIEARKDAITRWLMLPWRPEFVEISEHNTNLQGD